MQSAEENNTGDSGWSIPHLPFSSEDWDSYYSNRKRRCGMDQHKFIDTGMRRTYCKLCDQRADIDYMTGVVTLLVDSEEEK